MPTGVGGVYVHGMYGRVYLPGYREGIYRVVYLPGYRGEAYTGWCIPLP